MVEKINDFIKKYNMLEACEHVVVGLSGGADSVCLLHVLHSIIEHNALNVKLMAVHINHNIRGDEAARDEAFAREFCERLGVEYVSESVNIPQIAAGEGISEEEAGRRERYSVFVKYAGIYGKIAVAHHMDDQAETVLMNIIRGSSIKGLGGMEPVRDNIIRPLLCVTRSEIEEYLAKRNIAYVTDSTNNDNIYTRNRIRNELLPYIKNNFNPEVVKHIVDMSYEMRQADEYLSCCADDFIRRHVTVKDDMTYVIDAWAMRGKAEIIRSKVIMELMYRLSYSHKDLYRSHVEAVVKLLDMQVGKCVTLPYGMRAVRNYESIDLCVGSRVQLPQSVGGYEVNVDIKSMDENGGRVEILVNQNVYDGQSLRMLRSVIFDVNEQRFIKSSYVDKKNVYTKCFDYDKIKGAIALRFRREGDMITVCSDGKKRKLKKEFIDRKVRKDVRDSVMLLTQEDKVLWAIGVRRCEEYLVDENSKKVLKISVNFVEEE